MDVKITGDEETIIMNAAFQKARKFLKKQRIRQFVLSVGMGPVLDVERDALIVYRQKHFGKFKRAMWKRKVDGS